MAPIRAIAMISNGISAAMLQGALARDGYALQEVALILQRKLDLDWTKHCAEVIDYGVSPSLRLVGQIKTIGYYRRATKRLKAWIAAGTVEDIYIANIDNILSNHALQTVRAQGGPRLSVVAEGFMNYQEIGIDDRAGWRWMVKPAIARALGLSYVQPRTHLSGAYEPEISRVFTYSPTGIKSPPEKVIEVRFPEVTARVTTEPGTALIVLTGIAQWMTPEHFAAFKAAFGKWIASQSYDRILVKRHPFYPSGGMEDVLPKHTIVVDSRNLEQMAADIPAATVIGYCTTALVTLKLVRPELRCIDWGSDFYCEHAYHGDDSVVNVLRSAGVETVEMRFHQPSTSAPTD